MAAQVVYDVFVVDGREFRRVGSWRGRSNVSHKQVAAEVAAQWPDVAGRELTLTWSEPASAKVIAPTPAELGSRGAT